jgi:serine/threonine-protein kinase RsbW
MTHVTNSPPGPRLAMFHAKVAELRPLSTFVEGFCSEAAIPRQHCLRLNLVLEELFVNTIRHGHGADSEAPVWMHLASTADAVHVTYEDTAPPFNPYAKLPVTPPDTTLEMRKIGGLGVLLTKELARTRDYSYVFGRNRVRLVLQR